jgi:hypothetical protein
MQVSKVRDVLHAIPRRRVLPEDEGQGVMLLPIVEGEALLTVGPGRGEFSQVEQSDPQRPMSLQEAGRIMPIL